MSDIRKVKEIIVTISDVEGMVLFETSTAQIRKEIREDFPNEAPEIKARDILDALESELEAALCQS